MLNVRRREFITLLGGAATQQPAMPVIGFLNSELPSQLAHLLDAFRQGLGEAGFVEHRNVGIEYRWAEGRYDRLPALAADLVKRQVAVIAASGGSVLAAKAATTTIPIVFVTGIDPVERGIVDSLGRPGGNLTGVTIFTAILAAKRLELLRELLPKATVIGMLGNPNNLNTQLQSRDAAEAARALGLQLRAASATNERDLDTAFASFVQQRVDAALVLSRSVLQQPARTDRCAGSTPCDARNLWIGRIRRGRRPDELRRRRCCLSQSWPELCRAHSERRTSGRAACPAGDKIQSCYQPQNRKGAGPLSCHNLKSALVRPSWQRNSA